MKRIFLLIAMAAMVFQAHYVSANSIYVDAGYVGYIYYQPVITTWLDAGFEGIVKGPGNWSWRPWEYEVILIDVRPKTYDEPFQILAKDQLNIKFEIHAILRADDNRVKEIVEKFGGVDWYKRVVQAPLRTFVQKTVENYSSQEANDNRSKVEEEVAKYMQEYLNDKPFKLDSLTVGNIQFPDTVTKAVEAKVANQQLMEKKKTDMLIAEQEAKIRVIEAGGIKESQEIIRQSLNPIYVQHELIKGLIEISKQPGNVIYFVPTDENGLPRITNVNDVSQAREPNPVRRSQDQQMIDVSTSNPQGHEHTLEGDVRIQP